MSHIVLYSPCSSAAGLSGDKFPWPKPSFHKPPPSSYPHPLAVVSHEGPTRAMTSPNNSPVPYWFASAMRVSCRSRFLLTQRITYLDNEAYYIGRQPTVYISRPFFIFGCKLLSTSQYGPESGVEQLNAVSLATLVETCIYGFCVTFPLEVSWASAAAMSTGAPRFPAGPAWAHFLRLVCLAGRFARFPK